MSHNIHAWSLEMNYFVKFGRRIPIPSTLEISHELRALYSENARDHCAELDGLRVGVGWDEIVKRREALAVKWKC